MDAIKEIKDLLPILVFLLPGFVSTGIVGMLVIRKPKETFDKIVEAFILTTVNLVLFVVLQSVLRRIPHLKFDTHDFFTPSNLLLMTFCSVAIGVGWAAEATNDWLFTRLRKWGITKKTTHVSTWNETFHGEKKYVVVHLTDSRRMYGFPTYYSDDPAERAIYLTDASWLLEGNKLHNNPTINIFLDKESGIELIEFLDDDYVPSEPDVECGRSVAVVEAQVAAPPLLAEAPLIPVRTPITPVKVE
jgi:hypothetical protein